MSLSANDSLTSLENPMQYCIEEFQKNLHDKKPFESVSGGSGCPSAIGDSGCCEVKLNFTEECPSGHIKYSTANVKNYVCGKKIK